MFGGGGFNGILITGLGPVRDAPAGAASPLAQGYVTMGTDSGHAAQGITDVEPARFALNDEMFLNFAHESYKKVSDVAGALIRSYYGRPARFRYYMGGSEGGREALTMAQRYPNDFEGIVSVVPVISWTGLMNSFIGFTKPQFNGGALNEAEIRVVANAVNTACDGLDGIEDGVVSNYRACPVRFDLTRLKCPGGVDAGDTCLSDAQLATLQAAYGPTNFPFTLANGISSYPGRLFGGEIEPVSDGILRWVGGAGKPPSDPLTPEDARGVTYAINYARFVIARDPSFNVRNYSAELFADRIKTVSNLMDSTNPDLGPFYKLGGKLIIRENAGDFAQSPLAGIGYYENVVAKMGASAADKFIRLYVSPTSAHSGLAASLTTSKPVPTSHDLLVDLDRWVTVGAPPADVLLQVDNATTTPFATQSSRPMCRYPGYPRYISGKPAEATSYRCERSGP
jgi:feruloyl esterase